MTNTLKILIADDNRTNLNLMGMLARKIADAQVLAFDNPGDIVQAMDRLDFDIALIDHQMPGVTGVELINMLRQRPHFASKPFVIITADKDPAIKKQALEAGAVEFMHKPIEPIEFGTRLRNLARLAEAQHKLQDQATLLSERVDLATAELREREEEIISRLSLAASYKDRETELHTHRVARYSELVARGLGMDPEFCTNIRLATPMHDIGKVGIRDEVLLKKGLLSEAEREHMHCHTTIGSSILSGSSVPLLQLAGEIALSHHERWDGAGYPRRLKGTEIPVSGRIVAIADVFDALTTVRPYKRAWTLDEAFTYVKAQSGGQFDPACVSAFMAARAQIEAIAAKATALDQAA
jgi:putative two-component system response regulator